MRYWLGNAYSEKKNGGWRIGEKVKVVNGVIEPAAYGIH